MKTPIVEKSTLKGIVIGFAVFCLFSLTVFISRAVDFSSYKIIPPARELKQETWNKLVGSIEGLFDAFKNDISKYEIPVGTVIIYAGDGGCPKGWNQWGDGLDGRLLMPLQTSDGTEVKYGGKKSFTILNENLPKHSHKIIYNGEGSAGISQSSYLAVKNFGSSNIGYADYHLKGTTKAANVGLTSEEGGTSKPIQFMPRYVKVLFCIKGQNNPGYDGGNGDDDVVSPQCGTKNGKTGEPTTVEEKCGVGTPSAVTPYNGGYTWKCSNGDLSVDCSSSLSGCPDGQHLNNGLCVADPQCGSKNNQTGEPTTSAEKCSEGTAGPVTSSNGGYAWTCVNGGQTVSCSSSLEEVNGMCDFTTASCVIGSEYEPVQTDNNGVVWRCKKTTGNLTTQTCALHWGCTGGGGGGGSCISKGDSHCANMYSQSSSYTEAECKAAGAYWNGNNTWGSPCNIGDISSSWPHYYTFSPAPSCGSYSSNHNTTSCFTWESNSSNNGTLTCMVDGNGGSLTYKGSQAESACSAISNKKPSSCGGGSSSTYTDYCTKVKDTCQNGGTLKAGASFLPAGEFYGWVFYCVGNNGTVEQTCRGCRLGCTLYGDACYKVDAAGKVTQNRCD